MLYKFSKDFVAASVFEAGDGGEETHWNNLMVLHSHFHLFSVTCRRRSELISVKLGTWMKFQYQCFPLKTSNVVKQVNAFQQNAKNTVPGHRIAYMQCTFSRV